MEKNRGLGDKELIDKMSHEVSKGPMYFSPVVMRPLRNAVNKVTVSDEFKEKLQKKLQKKRKE